jgi:tetratricopeptide (TPR) repeat protein
MTHMTRLPFSAFTFATVLLTAAIPAMISTTAVQSQPLTDRRLEAIAPTQTKAQRPSVIAQANDGLQPGKDQRQLLIRDAITNYQAKRFQAAIEPLEKLVQIDPDDYNIRVLLGGSYFETKQYAEAAGAFQQAAQLRPKSSTAWSLLGNAQNQLKQYTNSTVAFTTAISLDSNNLDAHLGLGIAYYNTQQYNQAAQHYKRYTEIKPDRAAGYAYLGDAYRRGGKFTEAIAAYEQALTIDPTSPIAKVGLERAKAKQS